MELKLSRVARPVALVALALVLAGYSWWATALSPFTRPALAATLAAGLLFMIVGSRFRDVSEDSTPASAAGARVWAVLLLLLGVWELSAFLQRPRAEHPTISHLANMVLDDHPVRALAFLIWLLFAMDLARR